MKNQIILLSTIWVMIGLSGCAVVGGIFKAGMLWGILLVVLVVVAIIAMITRAGRK